MTGNKVDRSNSLSYFKSQHESRRKSVSVFTQRTLALHQSWGWIDGKVTGYPHGFAQWIPWRAWLQLIWNGSIFLEDPGSSWQNFQRRKAKSCHSWEARAESLSESSLFIFGFPVAESQVAIAKVSLRLESVLFCKCWQKLESESTKLAADLQPGILREVWRGCGSILQLFQMLISSFSWQKGYHHRVNWV